MSEDLTSADKEINSTDAETATTPSVEETPTSPKSPTLDGESVTIVSENVDGAPSAKDVDEVLWEGDLRIKAMLLWDKCYVKMGKNMLEVYGSKKDAQTKSPKQLIIFNDVKEINIQPKRIVVTTTGPVSQLKAAKKGEEKTLAAFGTLLQSTVKAFHDLTKSIDVKNISDVQREQIEELRKNLKPEYVAKYPTLANDINLLCFLKKKEFKIQDAKALWEHSIEFRETHGFGEATMKNIWHHYPADWTVAINKKDANGRPIRYTRITKPPKNFQIWAETVIYTTDRVLELADEYQTANYTHVMDYNGFTMKEHFNPQQVKAFSMMSMHVYPHRTPVTYIINAPWFLRMAYKAIRPFMQAEITSNLFIFGSDLKALYELVPPESLPTYVAGGAYEYNHEQYKQERLKLEGNTESDIRPADTPSECCSTLLPLLDNKQSKEDWNSDKTVAGALMEGWMTKQGGSVRTWKKRFCVLKDATLYYYKDDKTPQPQGFVKLTDVNKIEVHPSKPQFILSTVFRAYPFISKTIEERDKWVQHICESAPSIARLTSEKSTSNLSSSLSSPPASPAPAKPAVESSPAEQQPQQPDEAAVVV